MLYTELVDHKPNQTFYGAVEIIHRNPLADRGFPLGRVPTPQVQAKTYNLV